MGKHDVVTSTTDADLKAGARAGVRLGLGLAVGLVGAALVVVVAVLVRTAYPPLVDADLAVSRAAERAVEASPALLAVAKAVTLLGEPVLITVGAVLIAAGLAVTGRLRLALYVVAARVGALLLSQGLKHAVDRARPVFDSPVATALGPSFPSGHALGSAAFWTTTAILVLPRVRRSRPVLALAMLIAVLVAASRVLLGVHYLSDVTVGLLLGFGWAALCTAVFVRERSERRRPVEVAEQGIGA